MSDFYTPDPGTPCRHLQYGIGIVLTADEEYTTIKFKIGTKKFLTSIMTLDWSAEVQTQVPVKTESKSRVKRDPSFQPPKHSDGRRMRGPSIEKRCNQALRKDSTSGYPGVSWNIRTGTWIASICFQGNTRKLGSYPTAELASKAYKQAAREREAVITAKGVS